MNEGRKERGITCVAVFDPSVSLRTEKGAEGRIMYLERRENRREEDRVDEQYRYPSRYGMEDDHSMNCRGELPET